MNFEKLGIISDDLTRRAVSYKMNKAFEENYNKDFKIRKMDFSSSIYNGFIPDCLFLFHDIIELDLKSNMIYELDERFNSLKNLKKVDISGIRCLRRISEIFTNFTDLTFITCEKNSVFIPFGCNIEIVAMSYTPSAFCI